MEEGTITGALARNQGAVTAGCLWYPKLCASTCLQRAQAMVRVSQLEKQRGGQRWQGGEGFHSF